MTRAAATKSPNLLRAARLLREHNWRTSAGFYVANLGRCHGARVRAGVLQVQVRFERWEAVGVAKATITDHNGRAVALA